MIVIAKALSIGLISLLLAAGPALAQSRAPEHTVSFVNVQPGMRLELLDWGGRGPALVFLAGFGDSGHAFDGFAPQFIDRYHVLAITRRGFGASSRPGSGYDTPTLVSDVLSVLDSLHIQRAIFAGHSFAGTELTRLGAFHANRVAALIYLDASYDFPRLYADPRWKRAFPVPRPPAPTSGSIADWRRYYSLVTGPGLPDDEIRVFGSSTGSDTLSSVLQRGASASEFGRITSPVLSLWAAPRSAREQFPYWSSVDARARARLQSSFEDQEAVRAEHLAYFRAHVAGARIVAVAGGRHFLYLSHPKQVAAAMRAFLARHSAGGVGAKE